MIGVMLYEPCRELYFNYLQIRPTNGFHNFTYAGGGINVKRRKDPENNTEIRKRD